MKGKDWLQQGKPLRTLLGADISPIQSLPQKRLEIWPWSTACESLEQQQDSGPSHAKPPPQKLSKRRLRNPLKRKKNETKRLAPARNTFAKTLAHASRSRHIAYKACLKSVSKSGLGVPPAKASNSSKIRAQAMRNRHHKNSGNVAYETH